MTNFDQHLYWFFHHQYQLPNHSLGFQTVTENITIKYFAPPIIDLYPKDAPTDPELSEYFIKPQVFINSYHNTSTSELYIFNIIYKILINNNKTLALLNSNSDIHTIKLVANKYIKGLTVKLKKTPLTNTLNIDYMNFKIN